MDREVPETMGVLKERAAARLEAITTPNGIDRERVSQEIAILVSRSDVTEEVARLHVHLEQLQNAVEEGSPVGKRIDFLLQEINREITTYSNKIQGTGISSLIVQAKSKVEQLREQIQNVE
jgi:uncharacterized protein (TIGR00255 family)